MSCFNINLQQGSSFKRVPLIKEIIYLTIKSLVFVVLVGYWEVSAGFAKFCNKEHCKRLNIETVPLWKHQAFVFIISGCNFQSIKGFVELNSLFLTFFCYITWFDETLATQDALQKRPLRQILLLFRSRLKNTNWYSTRSV